MKGRRTPHVLGLSWVPKTGHQMRAPGFCTGKNSKASHSEVKAVYLEIHIPRTECGPSQKVTEISNLKSGKIFTFALFFFLIFKGFKSSIHVNTVLY